MATNITKEEWVKYRDALKEHLITPDAFIQLTAIDIATERKKLFQRMCKKTLTMIETTSSGIQVTKCDDPCFSEKKVWEIIEKPIDWDKEWPLMLRIRKSMDSN